MHARERSSRCVGWLFRHLSGPWPANRDPHESAPQPVLWRSPRTTHGESRSPVNCCPRRRHLRTGAPGVSQLELTAGLLSIAADSELRCDPDKHDVELIRGRVALQVAGDSPWTLTAEGRTARLGGSRPRGSLARGRLRRVSRCQRNRGARAGGRDRGPSAADGRLDRGRRQGQDRGLFLRGTAAQLRLDDGDAPIARSGPAARRRCAKPIARPSGHQPLPCQRRARAPVALVQIDESFYNPFASQQEGTFVFQLPSGAAVSRFAMYVRPDLPIEGELIDQSRAAEIYQSIVNRRRDPAILEQIGDNLFRMRVFPIPGHDTKRILLDYTVPLEAVNGLYDFRLPLFYDLHPIADFQVRGILPPGAEFQSARSPTHSEVKFSRLPSGQTAFDWKQNDYLPDSDLIVRFGAPALTEPEAQATWLPRWSPTANRYQPPRRRRLALRRPWPLPTRVPGRKCSIFWLECRHGRARHRRTRLTCSFWPTRRRAAAVTPRLPKRSRQSFTTCPRTIGFV